MQIPIERSDTVSSITAIWIFANLSFTGMRAQDKGTIFWKVIAFIFGFPGTLLTLMVIPAGVQRAYGIDLPRKPEGRLDPTPQEGYWPNRS